MSSTSVVKFGGAVAIAGSSAVRPWAQSNKRQLTRAGEWSVVVAR
jgi:hypothetical protein